MVVQSTKHKAYYSIRIEGMSNSIKVLKRVTYDMRPIFAASELAYFIVVRRWFLDFVTPL